MQYMQGAPTVPMMPGQAMYSMPVMSFSNQMAFAPNSAGMMSIPMNNFPSMVSQQQQGVQFQTVSAPTTQMPTSYPQMSSANTIAPQAFQNLRI